MSSLNDVDKRYLVKILRMEGGLVLDYSDAAFGEFFNRHNIDIHGGKYQTYGSSKGKKLRAFWEQESDAIVAPILSEMLDSCEADRDLNGREVDVVVLAKCRAIVLRLSGKPHQGSASGTSTRPSTKATMNESPTIGIITALPVELAAMKSMLDRPREYEVSGRGAGRSYWLGELPGKGGTKHLVAVCCVVMGNNQASARATRLLEHFQGVDAIIMVGIAGAVPNHKKSAEHVRLGDVVVSDHRGVVQYDFVKETRGSDGDVVVEHRFSPRPPGARLLEADRALQVKELEQEFLWENLLARAERLLENKRPSGADVLYDSANTRKKIKHPVDPKRRNGFPRVFRGPIASANVLLKDPTKRDMLRDKFGVKAVEMESSGVADATWLHEIGYLAVRGTCDYCDGAKNDDWHAYASIVAAAYTRELLSNITPTGTACERHVPLGDVSARASVLNSSSVRSGDHGAGQSPTTMAERPEDRFDNAEAPFALALDAASHAPTHATQTAPYPNLNGTWGGEIISSWEDPATKRKVEPIAVFVVVSQSGKDLKIRMLSSESRSTSLICQVQGSDGCWSIHGTYVNEPKALVRDRSPIHNGAIKLELGGTPLTILSGHYWTDRNTRGEMNLHIISREMAKDFAAAKSLAELALVRQRTI